MHRDPIEPGIASDISTVSPKGGSIGNTSLERLTGKAIGDLSEIRSLLNDLLKRVKKLEDDSGVIRTEKNEFKKDMVLYGGLNGNAIQSRSLVYELQTLKAPNIQATSIGRNREIRTDTNGIFEGYVDFDERAVCIVPFESDESVAVGDGTVSFTVPSYMNNYHLHDVVASVHTKGVTGSTDIQIRKRSVGTEYDMLSTMATIGDEYFSSDEVIDQANFSIFEGDQLYIDVDGIHSGTAPLGLSVTMVFRR
jgi:hypothetical protein